MSWFLPDSLKKRACRYLLQHYVGQFLQEKLSLEQLGVDLYNGTGHVNNVALDIWSLNAMLDQAHMPMELVDGYIGSIIVSIPWSSLFKDNCKVEIKGLEITMQPKFSTRMGMGNMADSFYRSLGNMTTSMQLAEGCMKEERESETKSSGGLFEGLEAFAQALESVLSRVKVSFTDMVVRVVNLSENSENGIALEMHIDRIEYFDEITMDGKDESSPNNNNAEKSQTKNPILQKDSVTCKRFRAFGIRVYLEEFQNQSRASPQEGLENDSSLPINMSDIPEFQTMTDHSTDPDKDTGEGPMLIGKFFGMHELRLRLRQNDHVTTPKVDAECCLGTCSIFLTPHQVHLLTEFANGISSHVYNSPPSQTRDEFMSLQTNNFAACTDGIKLSPNVGSYQSEVAEEPIRQRRQLHRDSYAVSPRSHQDEDEEQFFSMEGSKGFFPSHLGPSECGGSAYGTSVYSQTTDFTPSLYTNQTCLPKVPSTHPATRIVGGGQHQYGSHPRDIGGRHSSGREDEKPANHCRYQLQVCAMAVTILHVNPLPGSVSPSHSHSGFANVDSAINPKPGTGVDEGSSTSATCRGESLPDSQNAHNEMSEKYFSACETALNDILKTDKNISCARPALASVCYPYDHLRFTAAHIHISTEQKAAESLNTELTFGKAELTECVYSDFLPTKTKSPKKGSKMNSSPAANKKCPVHSEILVFEAKSDVLPFKKFTLDSPGVSSDIRIHISSRETSRAVKTSLLIHLAACESEVDISIVDRISTLLYPSEVQHKVPSTSASLFSPTSCYSHSNPDAFNRQAAFNEALTEDNKERQLYFNISASFLRINFRFPIADLRPEMERRPWYARSLRDETLFLEAHDIAFLASSLGSSGQSNNSGRNTWHSPNQCGNQKCQEFEVTVKDLHVLYSDEPGKPKSFLRISQSPADSELHGVEANNDLDCPHIKVIIAPVQESNLLQSSMSLSEHRSPTKFKAHEENGGAWFDEDFPLKGSQEMSRDGNPSPFSQRKVIYNGKEIILPGDTAEIRKFSDHAISTSVISISISLPAVNAFLVSKSFFENLYNRINNDILLWSPAAPRAQAITKSWVDPKMVSHAGDGILRYPDRGLDIASQFMVNSGTKEDFSISDTDSDDASTCYNRPSLLGASRRVIKSMNEEGSLVGQQSLLSIKTKIGHGKVSAKCNVLRDDGTACQMEHGEVVIKIHGAHIFNVTSYCGNPLLDYICVQITKFDLYHNSSVPSLSSIHKPIERLTGEEPADLDKVITCCQEDISRTFRSGGKSVNDESNVLVLAIKIETEEDRPMRHCVISAGVKGAMLHHKFARPGYSWLEQIIDFVDATDDQVLGYKPPSFVTEIHLNVKNSAMVYKPLHMSTPISTVLTASSFSMTSNVVAGAATSVLDIIVDEAKLYVTDINNLSDIDLLYDYACVLEVNFFELCLKMSNRNPTFEQCGTTVPVYPLIDLQASNNMIMLRTCADSCAALSALVRYLADDGDMSEMRDDKSDCQSQAPTENLGWTDQENPLPESDEEDVADLMAEAMKDIYEDAVSDFSALPKKCAMSESMYDFSTSRMNKATPIPHKSEDIMSQSMMVPSNSQQRKQTHHRGVRDAFSRKKGQDLYFSAFHKHAFSHLAEDQTEDGFCILDSDYDLSQRNKEPIITYRVCKEKSEESRKILLVENHFKQTLGKVDQLQTPEHMPTPVVRLTLKELSCIWFMYGGYDFKTPERPSSRKNSASGLQSSPARKPMQSKYSKSTKMRNAGGRDSATLIEAQLSKVCAQFDEFPEDTYEASRTVLIVTDFEVRDKLQSSSINKFLYRFHSEASPKQSHAKAFMIKLLQVRPEGAGSPTESRLRISLQPLRLNIDQDTLNFLTKFFGEISSLVLQDGSSQSRMVTPPSSNETTIETSAAQNSASPKAVGTPYSSPVMSRPKPQEQTSRIYPDLDSVASRSSSLTGSVTSPGKKMSNGPYLQPTFFREVIFSPEVPIRLDYHGKRIDTEQGTLAGLLMGLGQLNCSQLKLKRVEHKHGILGVDKLITFLLNEWAADIRANQLPLILSGVGPMHSVVRLFKGFRDLVYLPVEQYRKDGRIVRGIKRGASSFGTSTAMATLEITNRAIGLLQSAAETTYELVSPVELHRREMRVQRNWRNLGSHAMYRQPVDIREGMGNAFTVVKHGVEDTAGAFVRVAQQEHERKGVTGAVGGVLRHIPPALVRPVIMATEATTNVLSGIRNQIQPDAKQQDEDKWKKAREEDAPKGFSHH